MRKIIFSFLTFVVVVMGFAGGVFQNQANAQTNWQAEVLISSEKVRVEVLPTGYDSVTNKYKYQFSWLMPKYRVYSMSIDGKIYQPKMTTNGVVETPYWFSPDITYTIDVFPYANGKGVSLGKGVFKAPSVVAEITKPALTEEEEYLLLFDYIFALPEISKKTVKSKNDKAAIWEIVLADSGSQNYESVKQYLSSNSIEFFDQAPILRKSLDVSTGSDEESYAPKFNDIKIYAGKQNASVKYKFKDDLTGKSEYARLYFVKEQGVWKMDFIRTMKGIFETLYDREV